MASAGKLFEIHGRTLDCNRSLTAKIVTEDEVGLVIGKDHFRLSDILMDESHRLRHVVPVLIAAIHPRAARLAKCEARKQQHEGNGGSAIPPAFSEMRDGNADAGYRGND